MDKKLLISFAILVIVIFLFLKHNKSSSFGNSKKTNKVALIIHVGNIKVFKQILKNYPKFFNNNNIDLYISCNNQNDYNIILTPKFSKEREISAIIDMHIGEECTHKYIFLFESSFSFTLLFRIKNKKNLNEVMINFNEFLKN